MPIMFGENSEWRKFNNVRYSTTATASLSTLSPNTSMWSVGSTSSALKMASVATGSTAEINAPNTRLKREEIKERRREEKEEERKEEEKERKKEKKRKREEEKKKERKQRRVE